MEQTPPDAPALPHAVRALWERTATSGDERKGDVGNAFQRVLVGPASERLLTGQREQTILDIAGRFTTGD